MEIKSVKLTKVKINEKNPRFIKDQKFSELINSLLVFPKMLLLRPIVVNNDYIALGGNMRFRSLIVIADMQDEEIKERIVSSLKYDKLPKEAQDNLINYWLNWKKNPTAQIVMADDLTDYEVEEFIIKDNINFGSWDMDLLSSEWEMGDLLEWGMEEWQFGVNDYSDKNKEIDTDQIEDKMIIKLEYTQEEYFQVKEQLSKIAATPEDAVWKLLGNA